MPLWVFTQKRVHMEFNLSVYFGMLGVLLIVKLKLISSRFVRILVLIWCLLLNHGRIRLEFLRICDDLVGVILLRIPIKEEIR